jgi:hypothetical protein
MNLPIAASIPVKLTQVSQVNNVLHCAVSNIDTTFGEMHVLLQVRWTGVFGANSHTTTLKNLICTNISFQKITQLSPGSNVLEVPASNADGFLWEIHVFLHLSWIDLFGTKWAIPHLEYSICKKFSFQKRPQFTKESNELDVTASNIDFLLQLSWMWLFGANRSYLQLQHLSSQK